MSFRNTGPTGGVPVFSYRGVPVFVNIWFGVLALFFLIQSPQTPAWGAWGGLIVVVCVVLAFLIHEFGHALMAKRYGLDAKILLHGMGGLCVHEATKTAKSRFWVTAAGPLAGFTVAFGIKILESVLSAIEPSLILTEVQPQVLGLSPLGEFLHFLASFNMMWSLFNLIPLWPLDGGILFEVLVKRYRRGTAADKIIHGVGVGVAAVLLAYALSTGSMLLVLIAGMLGWENLQLLQAAAGSSIRSVSRSRFSGRKETSAIPGSTLATEFAHKATMAMNEGKWREAARLMHQMRNQATLDPTLSDLSYEILGCAYTQLEEYEDALDYLEKAAISPQVEEARARCLEALGRTS
jgi:stage IV sporulation protein FB